LNDPEIRDEAIQVLRGLLERVVIAPAESALAMQLEKQWQRAPDAEKWLTLHAIASRST
jgi:hypothetical protein